MLTAEQVFEQHHGRRIDKWAHYFPIYDRHLWRFRGKSPRVLEIGVDHGGSLQFWRDYFGHGSKIIGVDINPQCAGLHTVSGTNIVIMNQTNPELADYGPFDIVIDDGSHLIADMEATFKNLWPHTRHVYLIEDMHSDHAVTLNAGSGGPPTLIWQYPWVVVAERPQRMIKGYPSRELNDAEIKATELFGVK
jgi:cephalosporin hydroxylase